jgi:glycosyltransferase domain-containing protein
MLIPFKSNLYVNSHGNNLAIILPTQNRPFYLARALRFYEEECLSFDVHLADSSDHQNKDLVKKIVRASSLNITMHDYEHGICPTKKFQDTLMAIDAEYFLMIADDDFILPDAISKCVQFLRENEDYSVAHGRSYRFSILENLDLKIASYLQHCLDMSDPVIRFISHMEDWSTSAYSVQRTKNVKEIVQFYAGFAGDIRSMEIYWYASNVLRGKVAKLELPYMFRQIGLPKEWRKNDFYVWAEEAKYHEKLIEKLSEELSSASGLSKKSCDDICRKSLRRWIKDHRPFSFINIFGYSVRYYKNKFLMKTGLDRLGNKDSTANELIKRYLSEHN